MLYSVDYLPLEYIFGKMITKSSANTFTSLFFKTEPIVLYLESPFLVIVHIALIYLVRQNLGNGLINFHLQPRVMTSNPLAKT